MVSEAFRPPSRNVWRRSLPCSHVNLQLKCEEFRETTECSKLGRARLSPFRAIQADRGKRLKCDLFIVCDHSDTELYSRGVRIRFQGAEELMSGIGMPWVKTVSTKTEHSRKKLYEDSPGQIIIVSDLQPSLFLLQVSLNYVLTSTPFLFPQNTSIFSNLASLKMNHETGNCPFIFSGNLTWEFQPSLKCIKVGVPITDSDKNKAW